MQVLEMGSNVLVYGDVLTVLVTGEKVWTAVLQDMPVDMVCSA